MFRGASGNRRITEKGFGGPGSGSGPNGPQRGDTTALIGLCAPPGPSPMAHGGLAPPRAAAPPGLGGKAPRGGNPRACAALGRRPPTALAAGPPRGNPRAPPSHLFPLYIEGQREGSQHTFVPRCCPPSPITSSSSRGAWRSPAGILHHHHHHAVVLPVSPSTSPSPLLDQEGGDVPELYV